MSVLGDVRIREAIEIGEIRIEPMAPDAIGSNSVDLHLSRHLAVYHEGLILDTDTRLDEAVERLTIPDYGWVLQPGELYLGSSGQAAARTCPSWRGRRARGGWASRCTSRRALGIFHSEGTGPWRSASSAPCASTAGSPSARSSSTRSRVTCGSPTGGSARRTTTTRALSRRPRVVADGSTSIRAGILREWNERSSTMAI